MALALWVAAGLLAITEPGIGRAPLPTYPTWTLSIPELFAHLPSLVVHLSPGMSVKNVIEGQQKKVGLEKMKIMDGQKR